MQQVSSVEGLLKKEEAWSPIPYFCSRPKLSIGFGYNLEDNPFPIELIKYLMRASDDYRHSNQIISINRDFYKNPLTLDEGLHLLRHQITVIGGALNTKITCWESLSEVRKACLISMAYQMGVTGLLLFHNTLAAIEQSDHDRAGFEMLDSKWARLDTPRRAKRHYRMMRFEEWPKYMR